MLMLGGPRGEARASSKEEVNPHIAKAKEHIAEGRHEQALQVLGEAARWPGNTPEQKVSIAFLEGVVHCHLGITNNNAEETRLCEDAFRRALSIDQKAQPSFPLSPKIAGQLEQVRQIVCANPPPPPPTLEPSKGPDLELSKAENPKPPPGPDYAQYRLPMAMVGGGVALAGALSWVRATSLDHQVRTADPSITTRAQLDGTLREGKTFETVGWVLLGTGAATALGSLLLPGSPTPALTPAVTGAPMKGGASMSLHWSIP